MHCGGTLAHSAPLFSPFLTDSPSAVPSAFPTSNIYSFLPQTRIFPGSVTAESALAVIWRTILLENPPYHPLFIGPHSYLRHLYTTYCWSRLLRRTHPQAPLPAPNEQTTSSIPPPSPSPSRRTLCCAPPKSKGPCRRISQTVTTPRGNRPSRNSLPWRRGKAESTTTRMGLLTRSCCTPRSTALVRPLPHMISTSK